MLAPLLILEILIRTQAGRAAQSEPVRRLGAAAGEPRRLPRRTEQRRAPDRRQRAWRLVGWVELITEPVDEVAIRMTARVITRSAPTYSALSRRRTARRWSSSTARCSAAGTARHAHRRQRSARHRRRPVLRGRHRHRLDAQPRRRARPRAARAAPVQPGLPGLPAAVARRRGSLPAAQPPQEPVVLVRQPGSVALPAERPGSATIYDQLRRRRRRARRDPGRPEQGPGHGGPEPSPHARAAARTRARPLVDAYGLQRLRPGRTAARLLPVLLAAQSARLHPAVAGSRGGGDRRRGVPQGPVGRPDEQEQAAGLGDLSRRSPRPGTPPPTMRRSRSTSTSECGPRAARAGDRRARVDEHVRDQPLNTSSAAPPDRPERRCRRDGRCRTSGARPSIGATPGRPCAARRCRPRRSPT